jgi:nucleotide-binding universal stress UspA family protein
MAPSTQNVRSGTRVGWPRRFPHASSRFHVRETMVGRAGGYPVQLDEDEVERRIQAQVKELSDSGIDASYELRGATAGGAAHALADAASDLGADLIVMGTRGQGAIAGLMVGGVTQRLLHVTSCPVLAVPPERTR